jgi:hypothetical protein
VAKEERRVRRTRRGGFELRLPPLERNLLRSLPSQLRELLDANDPAVKRLFPVAHPDDPELEAEYREMVRDELTMGRLSALRVMEATLEAERLDEEQLTAWLGALNDLRLVVGTQLDVSEEMEAVPDDDPAAPLQALYDYLTWLQDQVITALAAGLPEGGSD